MRAVRRCVVVALVVVTGCSRKPEVTGEPVSSATAINTPPVASAAAAAAATPPSTVPLDAGTKGTIACGQTRCNAASEVCVEDGDAGKRCASSSAKNVGSADYSYACDDSSDCEDGSWCCLASEAASGRTRCIRPFVADGEACALQACVPGDGTPCQQKQTCRDGFCRPSPSERATCAGARCPAETPACSWKDGKVACSAAGGDTYACTRKSDCGGMFCCEVTSPERFGVGGAPRSVCMLSCEVSYLRALCATNADCPQMLVTGLNGGVKQTKCLPPEPGAPEWLRHCGLP